MNKIAIECTPLAITTGFSWTKEGFGFGQMVFVYDEKTGKLHCDNEMMSKDFLKEMLCAMVDNCILND